MDKNSKNGWKHKKNFLKYEKKPRKMNQTGAFFLSRVAYAAPCPARSFRFISLRPAMLNHAAETWYIRHFDHLHGLDRCIRLYLFRLFVVHFIYIVRFVIFCVWFIFDFVVIVCTKFIWCANNANSVSVDLAPSIIRAPNEQKKNDCCCNNWKISQLQFYSTTVCVTVKVFWVFGILL